MTVERNLEGLGGWLVLVGLGIIISPLRIIAQVSPFYWRIFSDGTWKVLTTPVTGAYNPLWAPILYGEMLINSALVLTWLFIAYLFFTKRKIFPRWYIGILIFTLLFIAVDAMVIKSVLPNEPAFNPDTVKVFSQSLIGALIWIPYMLISKRVKLTFVK